MLLREPGRDPWGVLVVELLGRDLSRTLGGLDLEGVVLPEDPG